jgi:hypothetical protein
MKRQRTEKGSGRSTAASRGSWAQGKFSRVKPWSEWGAMRVKRGTAENIARFGETFASADDEQKAMRRETGYTGRGMYHGRGMYTGRGMYFAPAAAYAAGKAVDYAVANPKATRKFFSNVGRRLLGRGEYEMSNELIAGSSNSPPMFSSAGDEAGALTVSHREYVGDIFAPEAASVSQFTVQSFPLNPGLEQTFPWLSQIAQNYEEYEMKQCVFEFVSTVQDINSTNGQVGTVITATQYNPSEGDFKDKPAMAAYAHSVSGKSTDNQTHGVECDPKKLSGSEGKYVRANPVMSGEDLKTYDHGRFQLATHNIPSAMASGTLGELYVQYTVCLRKPKFFTGRGLGLTRSLFVADKDAKGGMTHTHPLSTDALRLEGQQNNLNISVVASNNTLTCTLPAYYGGNLRVSLVVEGTGTLTYGSNPVTSAVSGNVTKIADQYGAGLHGSNASDSPGSELSLFSTERLVYLLSVRVEPSTAAVDNVIVITTDIDSGTLEQSCLEFTEYNTYGQDSAPVLIDSGGSIITIA